MRAPAALLDVTQRCGGRVEHRERIQQLVHEVDEDREPEELRRHQAPSSRAGGSTRSGPTA